MPYMKVSSYPPERLPREGGGLRLFRKSEGKITAYASLRAATWIPAFAGKALGAKINIIKERLWPAGMAALIMHGLMIAAIALGISHPQGTSSHNFRAEVVFVSESEKGASKLLTSLLGDSVEKFDKTHLTKTSFSHCEERSDEAIQEPHSISLSLPLDRHALRARDDGNYSHLSNVKTAPVRQFFNKAPNGRGKQPIRSRAKPISPEGGHLSGEADAFPIFNPPPIYPYEAKRKGIQGVILVRLSLTEAGIVHKATTLPPHIDPLLEDAALSAVYQWRFKPGSRTLEVPIEFKLET